MIQTFNEFKNSKPLNEAANSVIKIDNINSTDDLYTNLESNILKAWKPFAKMHKLPLVEFDISKSSNSIKLYSSVQISEKTCGMFFNIFSKVDFESINKGTSVNVKFSQSMTEGFMVNNLIKFNLYLTYVTDKGENNSIDYTIDLKDNQPSNEIFYNIQEMKFVTVSDM